MLPSSPLPEPILQLLQGQLETLLLQSDTTVTEQYLLQRLGLKLQTTEAESAEYTLFRRHFILYHLLYRIQHQWIQQQTACLKIGLARVEITDWHSAVFPQYTDNKAAYYLNWQNYYQMSAEALSARIEQFWQAFATDAYNSESSLSLTEALACLPVCWPCSAGELRKAYRQQALLHHPDKGGDTATFQQLQQAYQRLLRELSVL
ncbi:DNA-J related domain-containing protein [Chromatiaceae bacterium AAb-1]|nr:DNA-J related domain-containing protein [Chromatiaceae bacterium AAb-1]